MNRPRFFRTRQAQALRLGVGAAALALGLVLAGCGAGGPPWEQPPVERLAAFEALTVVTLPASPEGEDEVLRPLAAELEYRLFEDRPYRRGDDLRLELGLAEYDLRARRVTLEYAFRDRAGHLIGTPQRIAIGPGAVADEHFVTGVSWEIFSRALDEVLAPTPEPSPKEVLARVCATGYGFRSTFGPEPVAGFRILRERGCGGTCRAAVENLGYRFVEAIVTPRDIELGLQRLPHMAPADRLIADGLVTEPGLYRFTLQEAGHPDCRNFDRALALFHTPQRSRCIATERIGRLTARHTYDPGLYVSRLYSWGLQHSRVRRIEALGQPDKHAEMIRHDVSFGWNPLNGNLTRSEGCPKDPGFRILEQVIPPTTNKF